MVRIHVSPLITKFMAKKNGVYVKIDDKMLEECYSSLSVVSNIQKKYKKFDSDSFLTEIRDSIVSKYLGFNKVNINKFGWDSSNDNEDSFLEVKQSSAYSSQIDGVFNDTTIEKAEELSSGKVTIAIGVWGSLNDLMFIVHGNNPDIGLFIKNRIIKSLENGKSKRPGTVHISIKKLITTYNFTVMPISSTKEEVEQFLKDKGINDFVIDEKPQIIYRRQSFRDVFRKIFGILR